MTDIEQLLSDCDLKVNSNASSVKEKLEAINTIVQVKVTQNKVLYYKELYRDVKKLFSLYIETIDERKFEYDVVNRKYILENLLIFEYKERLGLFEFLIRKLKKDGFEAEVIYFSSKQKSCKLSLLRAQFPKEGLKFFSCLITLNIWTILGSILTSYAIYFLILLPIDSPITLFDIHYKDISDNFWVNHFCNTILGIFSCNSESFVEPINIGGVLVVVIGKLVFILIVLKICIDKFIETFKSTF